jgi:uncharacterized protein VirK/YbjX
MFFNSFLQVARDRYYWSSPTRLARILWSIATNLPQQAEILRILSLPVFHAQVQIDPALPFKFLSTKYLLPGLSANERASCLLHHLRFVRDRLPGSFLRQRQELAIPIFEARAEDSAYTVTLGFPAKNATLEGELCLRLLVNGMEAYLLQFSVVPGSLVQSPERDAVFILQMQGVRGRYDEVRTATKALGEVAPPALLMAVLEGIADAWGIGEMAGISATSQYCYNEQSAAQFHAAYDDFYLELGATRTTAHFFSSPLPFRRKPVTRVANGHKSRMLKKRAYKRQIADEVCRWMTALAPQAEDPRILQFPMQDVSARSRNSSTG